MRSVLHDPRAEAGGRPRADRRKRRTPAPIGHPIFGGAEWEARGHPPASARQPRGVKALSKRADNLKA